MRYSLEDSIRGIFHRRFLEDSRTRYLGMNIREVLDILEASNSREFLYKPLPINKGQGCSFVIIKESKSKQYKLPLLLQVFSLS